MNDERRSSLGDDDFVGDRTPSPLGGGGTTNIGGGTSGAAMGNADTRRSNVNPIDDITDTDTIGDTGTAGGITGSEAGDGPTHRLTK